MKLLKIPAGNVHCGNGGKVTCDGEGVELFNMTHAARKINTKSASPDKKLVDEGLVLAEGSAGADQRMFFKAIAGHRVWEREMDRKVPA